MKNPQIEAFTKKGSIIKLPGKKEGKVVTRVVIDCEVPVEEGQAYIITVADPKHQEKVKAGKVLAYVLDTKAILLRKDEEPKPTKKGKGKKKKKKKKKKEAKEAPAEKGKVKKKKKKKGSKKKKKK